MKRLARFVVSPELLIQAMQMPEGTTIHRLYRDPTKHNGEFEFIVENDDFQEVEEGEIIPRIEPSTSTFPHKTVSGFFINTHEWDWELE